MEQAGKQRFLERQEGGSKHAVKHIQCQANMRGSQLKCFIVENVDGLVDKVRPKNSAAKKK